jgi:hypothetical protein
MTAAQAVARGNLLVNWPVRAIMLLGFVGAYLLFDTSSLFAGLVAITGFSSAWLWWSYFIPLWRAWALRRGADPNELQRLALEAQLVWPKGSFFERTEFRHNGR